MSTAGVNFPSFYEISDSWKDALAQFFSMVLEQEIELVFKVETSEGESKDTTRIASENSGSSSRVVSAVSIAGDFDGVAYYDFPEEMAVAVASKMLSLPPSECASVFVNDALGELANMVTGSFKNQFVARGIECHLSVPSITRGSSFTFEASDGAHCYHYCFRAGDHDLDLFLTLKSNGGPS